MCEDRLESNFIGVSKYFVLDFILNNQPDALIIQIYSVIKLYMPVSVAARSKA